MISLALALAASPVWAAKADRSKPLVFTANANSGADFVTQRHELRGDVIISQGSLLLRAEKVDMRETGEGYFQAYANGQAGKPVTFRQDRDVAGESFEGSADQIEYDQRTDTVRFIGNAILRQMRGTQALKEVSAATIVFNSRTEVLQIEAGAGAPNPNGRVRIVNMPPGAASAPAGDGAPLPALPLQPSTTLTPSRPKSK